MRPVKRVVQGIVLSYLLTACGEGPVAPPHQVCQKKKPGIKKSYIINGSPSNGLFPEVVNIACESLCTGTLIANDIVLTAAHCTCKDAKDIVVYIQGKEYKSTRYINHPIMDARLIFLKEKVTDIEPVRLSYNPPGYGDNVLMLGYGYDSQENGDHAPDGLMYGCNDVNAVTKTRITISAGDPKESTTCFGDSGGPIYIDGLLSGVIRGASYGSTTQCNRMVNYGIRVDYLLDWIFDNSGDSLIKIGKIERE